MVYTYDYSVECEPAMPVVELRLSRAFTTPTLESISEL